MFIVLLTPTRKFVGLISSSNFQSVGLPKRSSTSIRKQEVHSNGPVLDDTLLQDPEVTSRVFHTFYYVAYAQIYK